ncbi:MAG TPA: DUF2784 domain-containing protein [Methylococcaceae bacterium]|nr:DUF2784 domain-containing protein [Methylococcaceae bacterium]
MLYRLLADLTVVLHFAFILFVLAGGLAVLRHPRLVWLHLPAVVWGAAIEFTGWICPLTPLEQALRIKAGDAGYGGGFIEHYLIPLLYPGALTPEIQIVLGVAVICVNGAVYLVVWKGRRAGFSG